MPLQLTVSAVPAATMLGVVVRLGPGGSSLSTIVTVALVGTPNVYAASALSESMTVSLPARAVSSKVLTTIGAELAPAGISTLPVKV